MKLLSNNTLKEKEEETQLSNSIRTAILADLLHRNQQIDVVELLQISTFLDPRYKSKYLDDEETDNVIALITSDGLNIYKSLSQSNDGHHGTEKSQPPPAKRKHTLASLLKDNSDNSDNSSSDQSPEEKITVEIEKYKADEELDLDANPLCTLSHKSTH